jgi:hypothetical protein
MLEVIWLWYIDINGLHTDVQIDSLTSIINLTNMLAPLTSAAAA